MTTDEINRYIHVEIMGKCWHDTIVDDGYTVRCNDPFCKTEHPSPKGNHYFIEDRANYCSDASPRSLLNEVVAKVVERCGRSELGVIVSRLVIQAHSSQSHVWTASQGIGYLVSATAEQIARACVEAHQAK